MKNVTLTLLAAAAIGAISIGSVSAMPVNNLAGLGESHLQDARLVCDRLGDATTRGAPIARRVTTLGLATIRSAWLRILRSAWLRILRRAACRSWYRPVRLRCVVTHRDLTTINFGPAGLKTGGFVTSGWLQIFSIRRCPLWVKSRHSHRKTSCPLYPQ